MDIEMAGRVIDQVDPNVLQPLLAAFFALVGVAGAELADKLCKPKRKWPPDPRDKKD